MIKDIEKVIFKVACDVDTLILPLQSNSFYLINLREENINVDFYTIKGKYLVSMFKTMLSTL